MNGGYTHHCTEAYCEYHDAAGECVYLPHLVWCPGDGGEHDRYGDCRHTVTYGNPGREYFEVQLLGSVDGGLNVDVQASINQQEDAAALIETLRAVFEMVRQDDEFRESRVPSD